MHLRSYYNYLWFVFRQGSTGTCRGTPGTRWSGTRRRGSTRSRWRTSCWRTTPSLSARSRRRGTTLCSGRRLPWTWYVSITQSTPFHWNKHMIHTESTHIHSNLLAESGSWLKQDYLCFYIFTYIYNFVEQLYRIMMIARKKSLYSIS